MTDIPILFSAQMVRALLDGRKTQTRRILKPQPAADVIRFGWDREGGASWTDQRFESGRLPCWAGDRLWCRETFSGEHRFTGIPPRDWTEGSAIWHWADGNPQDGDWTKPKPGIHMPRWASRLTLYVEDVKVERLQDISKEDARAEGTPDGLEHIHGPGGYRDIWNDINGAGAWDANPWVVAITFRVKRANIGPKA